MRKTIYIAICTVMLAACSDGADLGGRNGSEGVDIILGQGMFSTRVVDADNLESEQVINNISVFFTDTSSVDIVYRFVDVGFRTSGDYRIVTLPLTADQLGRKDIYVITNYDDLEGLEGLTTVTQMEQTRTPVVSKSDNLEAGRGFCMYGMLANFDFTDTSLGSPVVDVERTCAKLRITLSFPGNPRVSTDNSFLIAKAASYTYVMENTGDALPAGAYFNFASEIPLEISGTQFTNTAYIYEATQLPVLYIYTHMNGEDQEYSTDLPLPDRNYLYDIEVRIYEDLPASRSARAGGGYRTETTVRIFDRGGRLCLMEHR